MTTGGPLERDTHMPGTLTATRPRAAQSGAVTTSGGDRIEGQEFRDRREKLSLTRELLAAFARVSVSTLRTYELGSTRPRPDEYERLIDVLDTLEDGRPVSAVLTRTRTGRVIVAPGGLKDPDAADKILDEIVNQDGQG